MYDCGLCVVADALAGLTGENAKAWRLFHRLQCRFVVEQQAIGAMLVRLTTEEDAEMFDDTLARLAVIYDIAFPKRLEPSGGA